MVSTIEVFFCYAHEDEPLLKKLKKYLRPLQRLGLIDVWYDREISAGTEWEREIDKHLNSAQIILLLVSPDFMDSDYCYGKEMQRALERHERGEAKVIPVILRPAYWQGAPFGKLQALPKDAKPITGGGWRNRDTAFLSVTEGIQRVVKEISEYSPTVSFETISPLEQQNEVDFVSPLLPVPTTGNSLMLTVQQVEDAWENVIKRTRQKSSGTLAAMLRLYKIVDIEGTAEQPTIVLQSERQAHYKYVNNEDRYKILEWALTIQFGLECSVRLVPPNVIQKSQSSKLTVEQVRSAWEKVIKRTRQKSSGTLAAMLRLYKILDVEGTAEQPIIVLQSEKQFHYNYVKEEERYKILEWALTIEFGLECRVRLVSPDIDLQLFQPL